MFSKGQKQYRRKLQTQNDIAVGYFQKGLMIFSNELDSKRRDFFTSYVRKMEKANQMHMETLAAVFAYMDRKKIISVDNFDPEIILQNIEAPDGIDLAIMNLYIEKIPKYNKVWHSGKRKSRHITIESVLTNFQAIFINYMFCIANSNPNTIEQPQEIIFPEFEDYEEEPDDDYKLADEDDEIDKQQNVEADLDEYFEDVYNGPSESGGGVDVSNLLIFAPPAPQQPSTSSFTPRFYPVPRFT